LHAIGARLESGFDVVAGLVGLDEACDGADVVITGEGKCDATSFEGKVVGGVCDVAAEHEVPVVAVVAGQITAEARAVFAASPAITGYALVDRVWQEGEAFARAGTLVEEATVEAVRNARDAVID
jgi:glycerate kinase